jgi:hypothetical protein
MLDYEVELYDNGLNIFLCHEGGTLPLFSFCTESKHINFDNEKIINKYLNFKHSREIIKYEESLNKYFNVNINNMKYSDIKEMFINIENLTKEFLQSISELSNNIETEINNLKGEE